MPEGPDGKTIIIVKKVSGHGGHHGGAWKVAYADFVTAMMALFMVLWLVNTASVATRERVASYFREPGVFEKGSGTPLEIGGAGMLPDAFAPPTDANAQTLASKKIYNVPAIGGTSPDAFDTGQGISEEEMKALVDTKALEIESEKAAHEAAALADLADQLQKEIVRAEGASAATAAGAAGSAGTATGASGGGGVDGKLLGKVDVKVDQRGLHIEIMDTEKASMFESGSASIKGDAEAELKKIAAILKTVPNPIDIEGHTDGRPYSTPGSKTYDNWNLSTDRANAARRIFEEAGIEDKQIARVVGYASQRLKVPEDAFNATNRRISVSMRFTEMAAKALEGTNAKQTEPKKIGAEAEEKQKKLEAEKRAAEKLAAEKAKEAAVVPTPPPPQAAQLEVGTTSSHRTDGGLAVEVGTHLPEGEIITEEPRPAASTHKEGWMEKDKIFGNKNPFLPE